MNSRPQTKDMVAQLPSDRTDRVTLPSGPTVSMRSLNINQCATVEDCICLAQLLEVKIEKIDLQLKNHRAGHHGDGAPFSRYDPPHPGWEERAERALRWAQTQSDLLRRRMALLELRTRNSFERAFFETAKTHLSPGTFEAVEKHARELVGDAA